MTPMRTWLNADSMYEGYPIYFRRPRVLRTEFPLLQPRYPRLLVLTHVLTHVKSNGLPETAYNTSLEALSLALTLPFEDEKAGLIAVIETFAGKRTFYIYLAPSFDAEALVREVQARFPHENLHHEVDADPDWRVLNGYARDFDFP
jgi:hypothetical protein